MRQRMTQINQRLKESRERGGGLLTSVQPESAHQIGGLLAHDGQVCDAYEEKLGVLTLVLPA